MKTIEESIKTIEERAEEYGSKKGDISLSAVYNEALANIYKEGYIAGATEQKAIDIEKAKTAFGKACGWLSTYPWYNEVFADFIQHIEE